MTTHARTAMLIVALMFLQIPGLAQAPPPKHVTSDSGADQDRNSIYDDLDALMTNQSDTWRHDAIVTLNVAPTPSEIQSLKDDVGNFTIYSYKQNTTDSEGKPWTLIPAFAANLTKSQIQALAALDDVQQVEDDAPQAMQATPMGTEKIASGIQMVRDTAGYGYTGDADGNGIHSYNKNDIVVCLLDGGRLLAVVSGFRHEAGLPPAFGRGRGSSSSCASRASGP